LLTSEELANPLTVEGVSCPRCYQTPTEQQAKALATHRAKLLQVTTPLPGQQPHDNFRPLKIHARHDGWSILDFLCDVFRHIPRDEWLAQVQAGDIVDRDHRSVGPAQRVRPGERYFTRERRQSEPDVNADIEILHEDAALIVVNKPAPLPMHPSGRYHRNTLEWILRKVYVPQKPRPAHRLDANTAGVVALTRTAAFAKALQTQFERGEVEKQYLARVIGHPPSDFFQCDARITHGAGPCGSRTVDDTNGVPAKTEFEVLTRSSDGTALLRVKPRTGRTNQIRIHLWHLGWPIVGDMTYKAADQIGETQTLGVDDPPLCLFSWQLGFLHPQTQERVSFAAPLPAWA